MYTINKKDLQLLLRDKKEKVKKNKEGVFLEEITNVSSSVIVACEGEKDSLGHPKIYLNLEENGIHICPYCSRHFKRASEIIK